MRFLADEDVDRAIVSALRADGHDVLAVSESDPGSPDEVVARNASEQQRVLITEDRDFGRLFYAESAGTFGVIYLRYPIAARGRITQDLVALIANEGERLATTFVVMRPGRTRISRLPSA